VCICCAAAKTDIGYILDGSRMMRLQCPAPMSDPVNGVPPVPPAPHLNPRELPPTFTSWPTLVACLVMDNEAAHLQVTIGQLRFVGQHQLADIYTSAAQQLQAMREQWYRQQQGGIVLAGPGDLPRS
jgi:hypothetical protein